MKRPQRKKIELSNADLTLFRYLHFFRGARIDQIARDLFPYSNSKTLYWRLKKLEQLNYLHGKFSRYHGNKKILGITTKAFKEFIANGDEIRSELSSKSVDHDIDLVDIHKQITASKDITCYISENELRTWGPYKEMKNLEPSIALRSDASVKVTFPNGDFWIPLEYESNSKSIARYKDHLYQIYGLLGLVAVFYVCKNKKVKNAIQSVEEKYHNKERPMIYYSLLDDLKQNETITFTSRVGKVINLGKRNETIFTSRIAPDYSGALFLQEASQPL